MTPQVDKLALRQRLLQLLVTETTQLRQFLALLEEEKTILLQRNVDPLFGIAEKKAQVAGQLQKFADARLALLTQAGLKNDSQGIVTLIGDAASPEWTQYLDLASQARNLNQDNGQIVTEMLKHNHQALAVLLAHSEQPTVYGRDGQTRTRPGTRHLGSV